MLDLSSNLTRRILTICLLLSAVCLLLMRSHLFLYATTQQDLLFDHRPRLPSLHVHSPTLSTDSTAITGSVATIIEDRPLERLVPLLLHFSNVLGPNWPILIFTSQDIPQSAPFKRLIDESRIIIKFLPLGVHASTRWEYNRILTTSWLWEQLAPAEHVFLFQSDTIICANSLYTINDFAEYDFIAAPYDRWAGEETNDGLSLRNRSMTVGIVRAVDFGDLTKQANPQFDVVDSEEQWLYQKMRDLSRPSSSGYNPRLPSKETAIKFSVGKLWNERAFGYQQLTELSSVQRRDLDAWCPEYRLAIQGLPF